MNFNANDCKNLHQPPTFLYLVLLFWMFFIVIAKIPGSKYEE